MRQLILEQIDQIAESDLEPWLNDDVLDLMEEFAQGTEDLKLLVERYGNSHSLNIIGYLAFVLSSRANHPSPKSCHMIFSLIDNIQYNDEPGTLQCCLKTIWLQAMYDCFWVPIDQSPASLYPFVQRCLNYSRSLLRGTDVQKWVIQVISMLYEKEVFEYVFTIDQRTCIREKLTHLSLQEKDYFDKEHSWWYPYILEQNFLFLQSSVLDQLDNIEHNNLIREEDVESQAFFLMREFCSDYDRLSILTERYSESTNTHIAHALSNILLDNASNNNVEITRIIFNYLERIRYDENNIELLSNGLEMVQRQLNSKWICHPHSRPAPVLYRLLICCYSHSDSSLNLKGLGLLTAISATNSLLDKLFEPSQLISLHEVVKQMPLEKLSELSEHHPEWSVLLKDLLHE